jgi:hypothetical protein
VGYLDGSFGTGRKVLLRPKPTEDFKSWKRLPSWKIVIAGCHDGGALQAIYKAWTTDQPISLEIVAPFIAEPGCENTPDPVFLTVAKKTQLDFEDFY